MRLIHPIITSISLLLLTTVVPASAQMREHPTPVKKIIVDTDGGVDDFIALTYILNQREVSIVGIGAVSGNTTVEYAANNIRYLQDLSRNRAPVAIGAAAPLVQPRSTTGKLIHGVDGLWGIGAAHSHDLSMLRRDVPQFYAELATANPGATLLALGPLTNVAQAIQANPTAMKLLGRIVVLGGAKEGGNFTAVSEFNVGLDPEAAAIVFGSGIPITLVTLDATNQITFTTQELERILTWSPTLKAIKPAVMQYAAIQTGLGGQSAATLPDATAALIAVNPTVSNTVASLVKVELSGTLTRGKTIVASTFSEKLQTVATDAELSAIADQASTDPTFNISVALGTIATREPDNALFVTLTPAQARAAQTLISRGLK